MNRTVAIVAIVAITAALIVAIVWRMIPPPESECIHPPILAAADQQSSAVELANKLKAAVNESGKSGDSDSKFTAAFSEALRTQYDKLTDENVTFLLFSQAIYCYLKLNTKAGDRAAEQWTQMLYDRHRQRLGTQGVGTPLTAGEEARLQTSPAGAEALRLLRALPR